jgi:hypothetical protein
MNLNPAACCVPAPLGVIAPVVPLVFQLLIPLAFAVGTTLLLLSVRWILALGHWLWWRVAPQALTRPSSARIDGDGFEGVAVTGFTDGYAFSVPASSPDLKRNIAAFFEQRGARGQGEKDDLVFRRGSRFCSFFFSHLVPCRETAFLQHIRVELNRELKNEVSVCIRYTVRTFCMLRLRPSALQDEVQALYGLLSRRAVERPSLSAQCRV